MPIEEEKRIEVHPSVEVYTNDEFDDPLINFVAPFFTTLPAKESYIFLSSSSI